MLELRILTGLHRGASLPLEGETIRIGSGSENDIVLLDPGMPALASIIARSDTSAWHYRSCRSASESGEAFDAASASGGTALVAGTRWFAGPVLVGCEEEGTPWSGEPADAGASPREGNDERLAASKPVLIVALVAAVTVSALAAMLALQALPASPAHPATVTAATITSAPNAAGTSVRLISGTVFPDEAIRQPPFGIRSASGGRYGFVVIDDDHVLIPGSRWGAFTLVSLEPRRAVFAGPYNAELRW
jgi:type III secretion protein D